MISTVTTAPWVIVAGGFHDKGGMDRANLALAEYLLERQSTVHLITHAADASLHSHPRATVYLVSRPAGSFLLGELALAAKARSIIRRIVHEQPQTRVVVNGGNCVWPGINWVHYVHHAWSGEENGALVYNVKNKLSETWARKTERAAFRRARLVITNSKRTSRDVIEYFGVPENRVHTVYLGSDPAWGPVFPQERSASRHSLGISEDRPLAAFVGGLGYDHRKGFDILLRAWKNLCTRPDWDADLLVAGDGPAAPMWRAEILKSGLSDRIRFLGFSTQVKSLLAAVDLLISPARYEAYGLNVQEAICRGVPAMVSARAGVAEQYGSDLAPMLISDPEDAGALTGQLLCWRQKKDERRARFQAISARLRSRTWRDTAAEFVTVAERGLGDPTARLELVAGNRNS